ncbi:hypothetical protein ACIBL5_25395 [Streptomyces sp. NPDC050516]|uniref:hypothetical protein n=1 Tax=Streptomyces sp. NPDC050516 TaxID=3365621 RepID=UPI00379ED74A
MTPCSTTTAPDRPPTPFRFLLLGDSHAGPVGRAAKGAGIPFQGGPIGAGREFNAEFFDVRGDDVVFRKAEADALYRRFLAGLGVTGLGRIGVPLVCTFGFSAHFLATTENWRIYRVPGGGFPAGFLASGLFDAVVRATVRDALAFYGHARSLGLTVLAVMPPQRVPGLSDPAVFMAAQETVHRALVELGVDIVDLRSRVADEQGVQRAEFCEPDDTIHGNLAFGRLILADLLARGL